MEMFKCGHGTCKECYQKIIEESKNSLLVGFKGCPLSFSCPLCRGDEQQHIIGFLADQTGSWTTFSEWYSDYEIYIKSGVAKNVVKNSTFGRQLLRLVRETRNSNSRTNSSTRK